MKKLKVVEIFHSIQGEGLRIGEPQIFIRLAGCNMRCRWCDTAYSWDEKDVKEMTPNEIINEIENYPCRSVHITGGEPLIQAEPLEMLIRLLKLKGYFVHLSTNGSIYDKTIFQLCDFVSMDMKPPSSGMKSDLENLWRLYYLKGEDCEFKIVIAGEEDLKFALYIIYPKTCGTIILQPEGGVNIKWLVDELKKYNLRNVRVLPQLHKIIYGKRRGV